MKIKTAGIIAAATIMCASTAANANLIFDVYAGGTVGIGGQTTFWGNNNHISNNAQAYGAVVGIDIPVFRFELEYNYLNAADIDMHIGLINAYAKMPTPIAKPYVGVGIGSIFHGKTDYGHNVSGDAAYQAMLGLTLDIPILPVDLDIEGRVLYAPDIIDTGIKTPDLLHYDARVKLRYIF